jgi:hypothetical protein
MDYQGTVLETIIHCFLASKHPIRTAFNTAERWSEDVLEDVAHEIRRLCDLQMRDIPPPIQGFVEGREGGSGN